MINHKGECHCGKIRFMFKAPSITSLTICNCSICNALGFQHIFIPHKNFTLLSGENFLKSYRKIYRINKIKILKLPKDKDVCDLKGKIDEYYYEIK